MQFTCMLTKGGLDFRVKSLSTRKCCISLYINMHSAEGFILQQLKIKRQRKTGKHMNLLKVLSYLLIQGIMIHEVVIALQLFYF